MANSWDNLKPWVSALLARQYLLPDKPFSLDEADAEGMLPWLAFVGTLWLGAQSWKRVIDGKARFHVDLHWDYTNRCR
jgi:hypothetical protein